jgi:peptidoglycan-associated lipoprotein
MPEQTLPEPHAGHDRQNRRVRICQSLDAEACTLEVATQSGSRVPLDLASKHGMVAAEPGQRGDIQHEVTSRPHHPIHLLEGGGSSMVVERVDDVERRHDVEDAVGKRERRGRGLSDRPLAVRAGVGQAAVSQIDAERATVAAQQPKVVAGSAPAIQDARVTSALERCRRVFEEGTNEAAEAMKPKMLALGAGRHFEKSIHVQSPGLVGDSILEEKLMKRRFTLGALAMFSLALAAEGCREKKPPVTAPPPPPPAQTQPETKPQPPPPPPPPPAEQPRQATEDEIFAKTTLEELNAKGVLGDVLFAYDSTELTPEGRGTIQKNSDYLKRWPTTKVMVEGHADSRGTNEYNLALGEKRADVTRDYLVSLGVANDRVTIVSKGEEQPVCTEETESCWQRNRRGKFIFTAK